MKINVIAGDCLDQILSEKYPEEACVPFLEETMDGPCSFCPIFP